MSDHLASVGNVVDPGYRHVPKTVSPGPALVLRFIGKEIRKPCRKIGLPAPPPMPRLSRG